MKNFSIILTVLLALILLTACGDDKMAQLRKETQTKAQGIFAVVPDKMPGSENDTPARIELGKKLFFETRLSENNEMSCNTCHMIDNKKGGVDNKPTSPGTKAGTIGTRNSPTVLNAGFQFAQFWDGRAKNLKEQAKGPILNPVEMAMADSMAVVNMLRGTDEYAALFESAFGPGKDKITYDNMAEAIAAFERTLVTHDRFDDFLKGNINALNDEEVQGLDLFISKTCISCHTGPMLGGNMYQKMGLIKPYADQEDQGRYEVTKQDIDRMMFKVPVLRNIGLTAPYMHDGKVATLEEAVKLMADIQLGQTLTDEETAKIVAFLNSLSDKMRVTTAAK
jgi:cytochrome c peroxidase